MNILDKRDEMLTGKSYPKPKHLVGADLISLVTSKSTFSPSGIFGGAKPGTNTALKRKGGNTITLVSL